MKQKIVTIMIVPIIVLINVTQQVVIFTNFVMTMVAKMGYAPKLVQGNVT
jgi:hypothetical protein